MEVIGMLYLSNFGRLLSQLRSGRLSKKKYVLNGFTQYFFGFKRMQIEFELVMRPFKTASDMGALVIRTKDGKPLKAFRENDAEDLARFVSATFDSIATLTFTDSTGKDFEFAFDKGKPIPVATTLFEFERKSEAEYLKAHSERAFDCYKRLE